MGIRARCIRHHHRTSSCLNVARSAETNSWVSCCVIPARSLRSAPAQNTPSTVERTTRQRVLCSRVTLVSASVSSLRNWRPIAFLASGRVRESWKMPSLSPSSCAEVCAWRGRGWSYRFQLDVQGADTSLLLLECHVTQRRCATSAVSKHKRQHRCSCDQLGSANGSVGNLAMEHGNSLDVNMVRIQ